MSLEMYDDILNFMRNVCGYIECHEKCMIIF